MNRSVALERAKELLQEMQSREAKSLSDAKARLEAEVFNSPEMIELVADQLLQELDPLP